MSAALTLSFSAQEFTPVSSSRHLLESNGTLWRKIPRTSDPREAAELATEASVLSALGVWHHFDPVGPMLTTVTQGAQVETIDEAFLKSALPQLRRGFKAPAPAGLKRVESQLSLTWKEVLVQLGEEHPLTPVCYKVLDKVGACRTLNRGLVHGDPRATNWVTGDREVPALVNWETAMLGPIEYDLAVIAHELLITGRHDLLPMVEGPARNKAAFRWSLAIVGVRGLTQVAASCGVEAGEARRQLLSTVLKRF